MRWEPPGPSCYHEAQSLNTSMFGVRLSNSLSIRWDCLCVNSLTITVSSTEGNYYAGSPASGESRAAPVPQPHVISALGQPGQEHHGVHEAALVAVAQALCSGSLEPTSRHTHEATKGWASTESKAIQFSCTPFLTLLSRVIPAISKLCVAMIQYFPSILLALLPNQLEGTKLSP